MCIVGYRSLCAREFEAVPCLDLALPYGLATAFLKGDRYRQKRRRSIYASIQFFDLDFRFGEQFIGREIFFALVTCVRDAGQRFCGGVYKATDSFFEKRAGIGC